MHFDEIKYNVCFFFHVSELWLVWEIKVRVPSNGKLKFIFRLLNTNLHNPKL